MRRRPLPPVREETINSKSKWRTLCESENALYMLVASVGVLSYSNSLNGDFVHDDIPAIVTNKDVIGGNPVYRVFQNDFWGTPMWDSNSHKSYRPLTTLSFRLNFLISGLSPWSWHLTNVVLHCACCVLVARVGSCVAQLRRSYAALAGLMFAVHPIHTEAVAGVVGRADVLSCFFFLSSLLLYHGRCPRGVWPTVTLAALSMLAKETGLTVLLFNISFDLYKSWNFSFRSTQSKYQSPGISSRIIKLSASFVLLLLARLMMLQGSLPNFSPQDNPPAFHPSLYVRILTFSYLAAFNWWLLLCPWTLSHDWQMGSIPLITSLWDPRNLMTCAALLTIAAIFWKCLTDFEFQRHSPLVSGLFLMVIPYLPASNIFVTVGFVVAERVLYIPSVGFVFLISYGVQRICSGGRSRSRRWLWWGLVGVVVSVVSGGLKTHLRNQNWGTRETLLRADLAVLPHNAKLHYNFGNFLKDVEQHDNAIKHYTEALRLWPSYSSAHNNLGTLVVAIGKAEHHFLQALRYNRDHVNAHYNLGKLYRKKNRISESLNMLERCIKLEPNFVLAYLELMHLKSHEKKPALFQKILEIEPNNWEYHLMYAKWMNSKNLKPESVKHYLKALKLSFRRSSNHKGRGDVIVLTHTCLVLRDLGQRARILQIMIRIWSMSAGRWRGWQEGVRRALHADLTDRAQRYSRTPHTVAPTCLHHTQLEISEEQPTLDTFQQLDRLTDKIVVRSNLISVKDSCQQINSKKMSVQASDTRVNRSYEVKQKNLLERRSVSNENDNFIQTILK